MRRFFYVRRYQTSVAHMHFGKLLEGEAMACGRRLIGGYLWFSPRTRQTKVCKQCEAAKS